MHRSQTPKAGTAPDPQAEVAAFLRGHDSHGAPSWAEVVETHGALVFLHPTEALKIKRAMKYDYLDYSTLTKRRRMLLRELALNAPAAPTLYRDVLPLTRDAGGHLRWGGGGEVVEWVLRMKRFPHAAELSVLARAGGIDRALAEALGREVARYHAAAPHRDADGAALIEEIVEELARVLPEGQEVLGADRLQGYLRALRRVLLQQRALLRRRGEQGFIKRCHGDLHLGNLVMLDGRPTPYDALEFDERLGTCDVLYDLAFLVMDMLHQGLRPQANLVLNAYLRPDLPTDELAGLALLPLYLSLRAAIRCMVTLQKASFSSDPAPLRDEARCYLDQACGYLRPAAPRLVAMGGLSGSGKTTVARSLAPTIGAAPGAVHLRSDVLRKAMFGQEATHRLPRTAYASDVSAAVYDRMRAAAATILAAGHSVLLDAVHLPATERAAAAEVARRAGCRFHGFWLEAPASVLEGRVAARRGDASDADVAVLRAQLAQDRGAMEWWQVNAEAESEAVTATLRAALTRPPQLPHAAA